MSTDQVSRELAKLRRALTDHFGNDATSSTKLFKLAHQLVGTPQGVVLFDRLVCAIRTTLKDEL